MVSPRKIIQAIIESVYLGEKIKPIQEATRRILYKYGIEDEILFRRITGIVYNIFRNYGLIDYIIESITGINVYEVPSFERSILRVSCYIQQLDTVLYEKHKVKYHKYIVDFVEKKYGKVKSRNLLKALDSIAKVKWIPKNKYEEFMAKYRISIELYKALEKAFAELGEDIHVFLEYIQGKVREHVFRVNSLKASRNAIIKYLRDFGYDVVPGYYSPQAIRLKGSLGREVLRLIETGVLVAQDEASMVAVELLPLRKGIEIADLCAAPGGKTTYMAEKTLLKSRIHAFEINKDRVKRMRRLLERTGTIDSVKIYHSDARRAVEILGKNSVDVVLVDPPCSSTGAILRNPDVRWRFNESEIKTINKLQKELLETAYHIVKPGGHILYTTCSLLPIEGEYVVKYLLSKYSSITLVKLDKPFKESPILPGTMRSYPHIHRVTGFYYALLKKKNT